MSGILSGLLLFLAGVVIGGMILQVITAKYIFKDDRDNKENYDKGYTDGYSAATRTMQMANEKQNDNINSAIKRIRKFCRTQGKCSKCPIYTKVPSNPCMFRYGISPEYWHTLDISIDKDDEEDE